MWEACFNGYEHTSDYIGKAYFGCWWIFHQEYSYIRDWIMPGISTSSSFPYCSFRNSYTTEKINVLCHLKYKKKIHWLILPIPLHGYNRSVAKYLTALSKILILRHSVMYTELWSYELHFSISSHFILHK